MNNTERAQTYNRISSSTKRHLKFPDNYFNLTREQQALVDALLSVEKPSDIKEKDSFEDIDMRLNDLCSELSDLKYDIAILKNKGREDYDY